LHVFMRKATSLKRAGGHWDPVGAIWEPDGIPILTWWLQMFCWLFPVIANYKYMYIYIYLHTVICVYIYIYVCIFIEKPYEESKLITCLNPFYIIYIFVLVYVVRSCVILCF